MAGEGAREGGRACDSDSAAPASMQNLFPERPKVNTLYHLFRRAGLVPEDWRRGWEGEVCYVMHVPWPLLPTLALCRSRAGVSEFSLLLHFDPSSLPTMRPLLSVTPTTSPFPLLQQVPFVWNANVGGS